MTEESLFTSAIGISDPTARAEFLERACKGDAKLRRDVEALLAAHAGSNPLDRPAVVVPEQTQAHVPSHEQPGTAIAGRYKLLEEIGAGGMGAVWVAEQLEPVKRKVALKLIKPGMDSRAVIARFEAERQALALMDHPNIAKVHDGGLTESGRPYFVMEYVKGIPITEYCDATRLSIAERLQLFIQVCHAVQHAHQKGVIHRDLKPSNILVAPYDGKPVPKVIDFGLAKAMHQPLTEKTLHTAHDSVLGTPLYMSPEQAQLNNLDVDTRSDVYSLGVLLYELLTGTTPLDRQRFKEAAWDEICRLIREEEPPHPSARLSSTATLPSLAASRQTEPLKLTNQLRGEVDWIVMKALEKERERRYESANDFAADIECYLAGEPVQAAPPSAGYRLRKFVQRHRGRVTVVVIVALTLIAGIVGTSWGWREALWQRDDADSARRNAEDSAREANAERKKAQDSAREANAQRARAEKQLVLAEFREYLLPLRGAEEAIGRGQMHLARDLLNQCNPNLKGWEHDYLLRQTLPRLDLGWHTADVSCVAFSPDGKQIVSGSGHHGISGEVKVWNAVTGQEVLTLTGHMNLIRGVAFSPDGKRIVSGSYDGTARVWDAATGKELLNLKVHTDGVNAVAFSFDGSRIVSGSLDKTVRVWDAVTGMQELTLKGHTNQVTSVAFSADSKRIVSASGEPGRPGEVKMWDAATGEDTLTLKGQTNWVRNVAFSADGKQIFGWDSGNNVVKVWNTTTGQEVLTLPLTSPVAKVSAVTGQGVLTMPLKEHGNSVTCVAFSRDGKRVVSGGGRLGSFGEVKVWDVGTGHDILTFKGHTSAVNSVAFSADGRRIVSGGWDRDVKVWDVANGERVVTQKGTGVGSVAFSPDSHLVVSGNHDSTVKVWNAATGQDVLTLKGHSSTVNCVAFSADGKRIVSGSHDRTIKVWDAATGQDVLTLKGHTSGVNSVAFSADGKRILSGSGDAGNSGELKMWDAATGLEVLTLKGHPLGINCVAISADGERIVSGSRDQTVKVWDAATGHEVLTLKGHSNRVCSVAFSPDGKRIISGASGGIAPAKPHRSLPGEIKVWDAATGEEVRTLTLKDYTGGVLAFSADGKRILSGDARWGRVNDGIMPPLCGEVKLWDAITGLETLTLTGHTLGANSVAFSPDGKRIVSGSDDGTINVWDATTGEEREAMSLMGHSSRINSVAFSPNGNRIVSASSDQSVKVWDVLSGVEVLTLRGHTSWVVNAAFSADGKRIVSGSGDKTAKLWDAATGRELFTLKGHTAEVISVAFSPDDKRIVSASGDGTIKMWDAATGLEMWTVPLKGYTDRISQLTFSPDGKWIIARYSAPRVWMREESDAIKMWEVATGREELTLTLPLKIDREWLGGGLAFSADGKRIVAGIGGNENRLGGGARVWDVATKQIVLTVKGHSNEVTNVAFSPDGKWIVSGSSRNDHPAEVKVWDTATGRQAVTLKGHTRVDAMVWWDVAPRQVVTRKENTDVVTSVAFSPDGRRIVSVSWDLIKVWNAPAAP